MHGGVACCAPSERAAIVAALDLEFVHGRGRTRGLAERFPHVLAASVEAELLVLRDGQGPAACCLLRPFDWHADGAAFRGAMLGLVFTWPRARGRGCASRLLEAAVERLAGQGVDFAVLWSGLRGFYERLGWQRADPGCLGRLELRGNLFAAETRGTQPPIAAIEAQRRRVLARYLARPPAAYRVLPLPAEQLTWHVAGPADDPQAWLAIGALDASRYVVDFGGEPAALAGLWPSAVAGARTVYINATEADRASSWLAGLSGIEWETQALAFWRALSRRLPDGVPAHWHLPFIDRI